MASGILREDGKDDVDLSTTTPNGRRPHAQSVALLALTGAS
jgi:hypothetical protein